MHPMEQIWTMVMIEIAKILLRVLVANLKIDAISLLYLKSVCNKNLAFRKVFVFL